MLLFKYERYLKHDFDLAVCVTLGTFPIWFHKTYPQNSEVFPFISLKITNTGNKVEIIIIYCHTHFTLQKRQCTKTIIRYKICTISDKNGPKLMRDHNKRWPLLVISHWASSHCHTIKCCLFISINTTNHYHILYVPSQYIHQL